MEPAADLGRSPDRIGSPTSVRTRPPLFSTVAKATQSET